MHAHTCTHTQYNFMFLITRTPEFKGKDGDTIWIYGGFEYFGILTNNLLQVHAIK